MESSNTIVVQGFEPPTEWTAPLTQSQERTSSAYINQNVERHRAVSADEITPRVPDTPVSALPINTTPPPPLTSTPSPQSPSIDEKSPLVVLSEQLRGALAYLIALYSVASVIHLLIFVIILLMGYTIGGETVNGFSPSIVVCGFGILWSALFPISHIEETATAHQRLLIPTWLFLQDQFLVSIVSASALVFFLFPAASIFTVHALDASFFTLLQNDPNTTEFRATIALIIGGGLLLVVDIILIVLASQLIEELQRPRRRAEEEERDAVRRKVLMIQARLQDDEKQSAALRGPSLVSEHVHSPASSMFVPSGTGGAAITPALRVLLFISLIIHSLFFSLLVAVAATTHGNSGVLVSVILYGVFIPSWFIGAYRVYIATFLSESWLVYFRMFTIFDMTIAYCFFWISLVIQLLSISSFPKFEHGLTYTEALSSYDRREYSLFVILYVCVPLVFIIYAVTFYILNRAMDSCQNVAAVTLQEREKLANNDLNNRNN